ncbi:MAG: sigma 54-interacting transcriptional regulator [Pseudomonadota bacterium]|nr:sigma 54-interacting transcriptional regulator [Pseudomonadota bacterium]
MATKHVRWQDFDKILVINRLKDLVSRWWKIQINFTDARGFIRGVPEGKFFHPSNSICKAIVKCDKGFDGCRSTARQTTIETTNLNRAKVSHCHAGFSTISVPIRIDDTYMGCVFADGFVAKETADKQKIQIKEYLQLNFNNAKLNLQKYLDSLTILSKREITYLTELINLVVAEILLVHRDLNNEKQARARLTQELGKYDLGGMIGKSAPMQELYHVIERVCASDATVLIQGENGTGKELIARAIHQNSSRQDKNFVVVNCGAFNENLLESELFGHVKGSFTGAIKDRKGLFAEADNGTLFLDEIGDTSPTMQVKMLRLLQEGTFTPVGSTKLLSSDVRILAATNKDLAAMVKSGKFREDLYYRLNVINIAVPSLRERSEDIPLLIDHFMRTAAANKQGNQPKSLSQECVNCLLNHSWPGNVRELENEIERLLVLAGSDNEISAALLSPRIREAPIENRIHNHRGSLREAMEQLEKQLIKEGLERTNWNKSRLAKELNISRAGLVMKVKKYQLEKRVVAP